MATDRRPQIVPDVLANGEDVTSETDRSLILRAVNLGLEAKHRLDAIVRGLKLELADIRQSIADRPSLHPLDPDSSYNVLDAQMREARDTLYARSKNPRDPLDSERARAIAREVVEAAKDAEDARTFRSWRVKGWQVTLAVIGGLAALAGSFIAGHYGLPH